jgi:TetR/AcrR family transcriptional regulator
MARPKSDIEPRILHAARECFIAHGVDGTSLRQIARAAHTNIGMIYYYFSTKDDLFLGVVEEIYEAILADIERILTKPEAFEKRLHALSVRFSELSKTELDVVHLIAREALSSSARRDRLIERFKRGHIALMIQTIFGAVGGGELDRRFHPGVLGMSSFVLCVVPQIIRQIAAKQLPFADMPSGNEFASQLVSILMDGARTKESETSRV